MKTAWALGQLAVAAATIVVVVNAFSMGVVALFELLREGARR